MPTLGRERFLSFSREFILGSRVASNLLVREMGKITHLSFPLGFFPQATLSSCRRTRNLMALPLAFASNSGRRATSHPRAIGQFYPFLWSRCVTSESDERGVH